MNLTHTAFFGDGEYTFALTDEMITELERLAGLGIGALYSRVISRQFNVADLVEIIRLGLIGGGTNPERAAQLTDTYARNRPFVEVLPVALDILDARWSGTVTEKPDTPDAAQTGDLSAALNEAAA